MTHIYGRLNADNLFLMFGKFHSERLILQNIFDIFEVIVKL